METFANHKVAQDFCDENGWDWQFDCGGDCCSSYSNYYIEGNQVFCESGGTSRDEPYEDVELIGDITAVDIGLEVAKI
jgi:hypothetical protein